MATKYCMFCGAQLPSTALYCPTCGNKQSVDESSIKVDQSVLENINEENDEEENSAEYGLLSAWGYTKSSTNEKKSTIPNVVNNTKQSQSVKPIQTMPQMGTNIEKSTITQKDDPIEEPKIEKTEVKEPLTEKPKRKGPKLGGKFEEEDFGYGPEAVIIDESTNLLKHSDPEPEVESQPEEIIEEVQEEIVEESEEPTLFEDEEEYDGLFDDDDDGNDNEEISDYMDNMFKGIEQPVPESLKVKENQTVNLNKTQEHLNDVTEQYDEDYIPDDQLVEPEHTSVSSENINRKFNPTGKGSVSYKKRNLSEEDESDDETFSADSMKVTSGISVNSDDDSDMLEDEKEDLRKYKAMKAKEKEEQEAIKKSQEVAAEGRTKSKRQKETRKNIDFIISQRKINEIQHEEVKVKGLDPDYDGYYETVKPIDYDKQKDNSAIIKTVLTGVIGFGLISAIFYILFSFFTL